MPFCSALVVIAMIWSWSVITCSAEVRSACISARVAQSIAAPARPHILPNCSLSSDSFRDRRSAFAPPSLYGHRHKYPRVHDYGSFVGTLTLPAGANEDDITATYDKGIFTLSVGVSEAAPAGKHVTERATN